MKLKLLFKKKKSNKQNRFIKIEFLEVERNELDALIGSLRLFGSGRKKRDAFMAEGIFLDEVCILSRIKHHDCPTISSFEFK